MLMYAARQFWLMVVEAAEAAHWDFWRLEPVKPPIRVWMSHIPDGDVEGEARFQFMRMAPGWGPCVETIMSLHSTIPVSPGFPT